MKYTSQLMKYTSQFAKCEAIIRSLLCEVFFTSYIREFYLLQMLCPHVTGFLYVIVFILVCFMRLS